MAGCLEYSSITSTRTGVGLGARGATRVKLGPPNSGINSMRSRAAARDTTPERAGVSEISRVAGRATLKIRKAEKKPTIQTVLLVGCCCVVDNPRRGPLWGQT